MKIYLSMIIASSSRTQWKGFRLWVVCLMFEFQLWTYHFPEETKVMTEILILKALYQFTSVTQSCPTLCSPMDCNTPGLPVQNQLPEFTQTHVCWVGDAIKPSHPLSFLSPPTFNLSQDQGLFKWVSSSHQVAKVLEFQLQHQSFQWIFRTDFL